MVGGILLYGAAWFIAGLSRNQALGLFLLLVAWVLIIELPLLSRISKAKEEPFLSLALRNADAKEKPEGQSDGPDETASLK